MTPVEWIMSKLSDLVSAWLVALWVGGLWAIGFLAVPVLFHRLHDEMLAGRLAGHLFGWIAYFGMAAAAWLLAHRLFRSGAGALKQTFFWIVLAMLLLTLAQHFGFQPILQHLKDQAAGDVMHSLFKERFMVWHGIASVAYLIEALLGLVLVAKQGSR